MKTLQSITKTKLLLILIVNMIYISPSYSQKLKGDSLNIHLLQQHEYAFDMKDNLKQKLLQQSIKSNMGMDVPFKIDLSSQYEILSYKPLLKPTENFNILPPNAYSIGDYSKLYLNHGQNNVPGISTVNTATATFRIQPTEDWFINIGSTASKYRDYSGMYNNLTIDASTYIPIAENFRLNVYGSYSTNAQNNVNAGAIMHSPFAPSSYYGGSVEIKITERFGIEAGMLREFNMWTRKWQNVYFATPKFYKKK